MVKRLIKAHSKNYSYFLNDQYFFRVERGRVLFVHRIPEDELRPIRMLLKDIRKANPRLNNR